MNDLDLMILSACRYLLKESSITPQDVALFKPILKKAKAHLKEWQIYQQLNEADDNLWWREDECYKYTQSTIKQALLESTTKRKLSDSELEVIYRYATLYAIGRLTYIVDCALNWTMELSPKLTQYTKEVILKRIDEFRVLGRLGMSCDVEVWDRIEKELTR